ncbi:MAG: hypothetical protein B6D37_01035 [Sphingobacteriales bacterium UTBCD1]|nr:MAG: hypothetical protein B6D37_01035 [Sphingobacteriales bacterium UTBCD1]
MQFACFINEIKLLKSYPCIHGNFILKISSVHLWQLISLNIICAYVAINFFEYYLCICGN